MKKYNLFSNIAFTLKYTFKISKASIFLTFVSSFLSATLVLFNLFIVKYILDVLTNNIGSEYAKYIFTVILITFLITICLNAVNAFLTNIISTLINEKIHKAIFLDIYYKTLQYNLSEFDDSEFYNKYFYVIDNAETSINSTRQIIGTIVSTVLSSIGLTAYLAMVDPTILFIILVSISLTCVFSMIIKKIRYSYDIQLVIERRKMNYVNRVFYMREYAKEVRSYSNSNLFVKKYNDSYENKQKLNLHFGKKLFGLSFSQNAVQTISNNAVLVTLVIKVLNGLITISQFVVAQNGASQLNTQLTTFINLIPSFYENSLKISRLREFFDYEPSRKKGNLQIEDIYSLAVKDLSFAYDKNFHLSDISFQIRKGEKLAIVGNNGAGKSTLAKIICGLYSADSGQILINNKININQVDINNLRLKVGAIFQDYQIFAFSIAENILMHPVISEEDEKLVNDALHFVGLDQKVLALPDGINTCITKEFSAEGAVFSGGELQKLALARVYAQNFDVIVFDELTSSFDPFAENDIYHMIDQISENKIVIFISHRLINMQHMDKIIYLDHGKIIESGTHRELMEKEGNYSKMYLVQAEKYMQK